MASTREELVCLNHELGFFSGACSLTGSSVRVHSGTPAWRARATTEQSSGMEGAVLAGAGDGICHCVRLCGSVWLSCSDGAMRRACDACRARGECVRTAPSFPVFLFSRRVPKGGGGVCDFERVICRRNSGRTSWPRLKP